MSQFESTEKLRLDKWLWAARFFKTRSLAAQAVEGGKVKLNGQRVKPAKALHAGDALEIHIGDYAWQVTVRELSARRGPAEAARKLYEEAEESQALRQAQVATRCVEKEPAAELHGRPTKRDRRMMKRFTGAG
ncbi:MAG: RNA-binding S4 domain-containing protein [Hydrogenophilales bacterium]|nr:RNA-binding S4 domain-containing protein [Hydrogenophilales bacterium]